ncbi:MAG: hypothetical protein OEW78_08610 [Nitrosopumilus sp.]|nr:hypothetical protein [Nitrosopumilus sp.]MDH5431923.1 hypothetical protein [Nitrosopumilus sp.]MDH5665409.1 hypothetical protein [Nitrosopumilus sp.]MDH5697018.1 hypothetical protein [Nitrosopumilus sp.]
MPKKHESSSKEIEIMRKFKEELQTPYLELAIKKEDHKKNKKIKTKSDV